MVFVNMTKEHIIEIMSNSEGHHIRYIEIAGQEWSGYVYVYESEYDNSGDDVNGPSICVQRDDGYNVVIYDHDIDFIEITDL